MEQLISISTQEIEENIKTTECLHLEEECEGTELVITGINQISNSNKDLDIVQFENV